MNQTLPRFPSSLIPPPSSLFSRCRCALRVGSQLARIFLADAGGLATQPAQIVELGATDATALDHINVVNDGRVQREDSLDTDAEAGLAHGDGLARPTVLARDDDALERLQALFGLRLFDAHVDAHRIARLKV